MQPTEGGAFLLKTPKKTKYKILMTTMQMDIGGAETHLLELSRALVANGHEVFVASNGGVFVKRLEEAGIRHIRVPLHTKKPVAICKSYTKLYRLILHEKFDIVHAHARIPAFICGLLRRRLPFCFITTAHWVFKTNPLLRRLTNWGDYTLAVSQDIKQYLIDSYNIYPDNISVTINGIDTDTFGGDIDYSDIAREFQLAKGARRIVCISRMDKSRAAVSRMLAELAPSLYARYPDIEILLVGGSVLSGERDELDYIRALAEKINRDADRSVVILPGSRTDIEKFIAASTVFVGVSRAALEAMSAEKPLILAGNEGYLGILDTDNLPDAYKTNFCCRGCPLPDINRLLSDLCTLLDSPADYLKRLGRQNREVILADYSAARMAHDYEQVYHRRIQIKPDKRDVIISGYYGFDNVGDDSVLSSIINGLRGEDPSLGITVLCNNPKKLSKTFGIRCIKRTHIIKILREMKKNRLLISGGGSLLQNATSAKSLLYYAAIIKLAKRNNLRIMLYSNGIGPIYGRLGQSIVRYLVNISDIVTLREPTSYNELKRLGARLDHVKITIDPAVCINTCDEERIDFIMNKTGFIEGRRYFAVSLRDFPKNLKRYNPGKQKDFEDKMAHLINQITETFDLYPVFIPMQPSNDMSVCHRIYRRTSKSSLLIERVSASEIVGILQRMEFVIGMRLHILIYAFNASIPIIGLSYDPKINAFLNYADLPGAFVCHSIDKEGIISLVEDFLENKATYQTNMKKTRQAFLKKAVENAALAAKTAKGS